MSSYISPRKLAAGDTVANFRCGRQPLDNWLQRFALTNQTTGMAKTYVVTPSGTSEVIGYYALATGGVAHEDASARAGKGVPKHPIPVIILARLAVHEDHQGQKLGRFLLRDALVRVASAADEIGVRALLVHAKDDEARDFYLAHGEFEPSPVDPLQLFLLLKDLRKSIQPG